MNRHTLAASMLMTCVPLALAVAEDTVVFHTGAGRETRMTGQVLDYDGRQLRLRLGDGREQVIPAERVLKVQTQYTAEQVEADRARDEGHPEAALVLYRKALDAEQRRWVRRAILREMVWCRRTLGQVEQAGDVFLLVARDGPGVDDFASMPLSWSAVAPSASLERAARGWMARDELPAAVLLGASHLVPIEPAAAERLKRLMVETDGPVAQLAAAQRWRTEVVTADAAKTAAWRQAIQRMPWALRAGPYLVLGRALARQGQLDEAALAMLRLPILYPRDRELAAVALLEAGEALEKVGRGGQAARLYREVVETYPSSRPAGEAQARWDAMTKK